MYIPSSHEGCKVLFVNLLFINHNVEQLNHLWVEMRNKFEISVGRLNTVCPLQLINIHDFLTTIKNSNTKLGDGNKNN